MKQFSGNGEAYWRPCVPYRTDSFPPTANNIDQRFPTSIPTAVSMGQVLAGKAWRKAAAFSGNFRRSEQQKELP
jgi:hypothetical protein